VSGPSDLGFGLGTAAGYGTADFLAKGATDRIGFLPTLLFVELIGTPLLVGLAFLLGGNGPSLGFPLALLVGLSFVNLTGSFFLYRSFEFGRLTIVSPLVSGYPALIVILSLLVLGERLSVASGLGIVLTLVGIVLLARVDSPLVNPPKNARVGLLSAGVAFVAYGVFFFGLKFVVGPISPTWVAAVARAVGLVTVLGYVALSGAVRAPPRSVRLPLVGVGILDSLANVAYNFGVAFTRSLAILGTLSGLFSAVTVAWAVVLWRERLGAAQWAGAGCVFLGVALISLG
jgi:drug/metabolite transporter (DMT)-like permease